MLDKLEAIQERHIYLEEQLSDPSIISDMSRFKKINKEYKDLKEIVEVYIEYKDLLGNIDTAKEMQNESDEEMKEMAKMELDELIPQRETLEERIKVLLIPKDPEDSKDVIFECILNILTRKVGRQKLLLLMKERLVDIIKSYWKFLVKRYMEN